MGCISWTWLYFFCIELKWGVIGCVLLLKLRSIMVNNLTQLNIWTLKDQYSDLNEL